MMLPVDRRRPSGKSESSEGQLMSEPCLGMGGVQRCRQDRKLNSGWSYGKALGGGYNCRLRDDREWSLGLGLDMFAYRLDY